MCKTLWLKPNSECLGENIRYALTECLLAKESGCSAYDCEFVSVTMDFGVLLVTAYRQVLRAFPQVAIIPEAFLQE